MDPYSNLLQHLPRHGLRLNVHLSLGRSHGRTCVNLNPVENLYQLRNNAGHMPWGERIQSTLTFPQEQNDLRLYICNHHLAHFETGATPVTDDCIVISGMSEVLDMWEEWDRTVADAEFSRGPVLARNVKHFVGLFRSSRSIRLSGKESGSINGGEGLRIWCAGGGS